jgi:IclR family transcriptional regulator, pca regulon regulatory protein
MGHVLLAALPAYERRTYLERTGFEALTAKTLTDRHAVAAAIDAVYRDGYAFGDEGFEEGLHAVAVPVTDGRGSVLAALGVATHAGPATPERLRDEYLQPLLDCAEQISAEVGRLNMPTLR